MQRCSSARRHSPFATTRAGRESSRTNSCRWPACRRAFPHGGRSPRSACCMPAVPARRVSSRSPRTSRACRWMPSGPAPCTAGPRCVPTSASSIARGSCMTSWHRSPPRSRPGARPCTALLIGRSAGSPRHSSAMRRPTSTSPLPRSIDERLDAPLFLARTNVSWARALITRGRPEDLDRIHPMLEQAEQAARRAGAAGTITKVAECRSALAAVGGPELDPGTGGQARQKRTNPSRPLDAG